MDNNWLCFAMALNQLGDAATAVEPSRVVTVDWPKEGLAVVTVHFSPAGRKAWAKRCRSGTQWVVRVG